MADLTDGGAHPEAGQTMPCGTLFSNLCAFEATQITDMLDLPPSAPPPPTLPEASLHPVEIFDVRASGGFDANPPPSPPAPPAPPPSPPSPPLSPPKGWVPVSCAMLTHALGGSDPQCATAVCVDDAQGRAVLSEGHTNDYTGVECTTTAGVISYCNIDCGCDSAWTVNGTEAGGTLATATSIRYRQVFSDKGNCFCMMNDCWKNWTDYAHADEPSYIVEHLVPGASRFERTKCGPNDDECTSSWWKYCDGGLDHTSVYVYDQPRSNAHAFGVQTMNGQCGSAGTWRYEAMEVLVPSPFPSQPPPSPPSLPPSPPPPPPEGWVPVSCAMLTHALGGSNPQCAMPVCVDDAQGRAVLSEGHTNDYTGVECTTTAGVISYCNIDCGCDSAWTVNGTEAGGTLATATSIRYRQVFSDKGACFCMMNQCWRLDGWDDYANADEPSYIVEHLVPGASHFARTQCGTPQRCNSSWWRSCDGGPDHTSVYVYDQLRSDANAFGVQTMNGQCGSAGTWRYEAMEVLVPAASGRRLAVEEPGEAAEARKLQEVTRDPLTDCTDSNGTPCIAYAEERPVSCTPPTSHPSRPRH